jgi:hypothetical protein
MKHVGPKELLINSNLRNNQYYPVKFYDAAGVEVNATTPAIAATASSMVIVGFATINKADIVKVNMTRGIAASQQASVLTITTFVAPAVPTQVSFRFRVTDYSYDAQNARNLFTFGDYKNFSIQVLPSDTAATVATKLIDLINFEANRYGTSLLRAVSGGSGVVNLSINTSNPHPEKMRFTLEVKDEDSMGLTPSTVVTAYTFTNTTSNSEGTGTAKYLTSNLKLLTDMTTRPYWGVYNHQLPVEGGLYANMYIETTFARNDIHGQSGTNEPVAGSGKFDIYVLGNTGAADDDRVLSSIAGFLDASTGSKLYYDRTTDGNGNLTPVATLAEYLA